MVSGETNPEAIPFRRPEVSAEKWVGLHIFSPSNTENFGNRRDGERVASDSQSQERHNEETFSGFRDLRWIVLCHRSPSGLFDGSGGRRGRRSRCWAPWPYWRGSRLRGRPSSCYRAEKNREDSN